PIRASRLVEFTGRLVQIGADVLQPALDLALAVFGIVRSTGHGGKEGSQHDRRAAHRGKRPAGSRPSNHTSHNSPFDTSTPQDSTPVTAFCGGFVGDFGDR